MHITTINTLHDYYQYRYCFIVPISMQSLPVPRASVVEARPPELRPVWRLGVFRVFQRLRALGFRDLEFRGLGIQSLPGVFRLFLHLWSCIGV